MVNKIKKTFLWVIILMLLGSSVGYAEVNYTTSAHGNSGYGVKRSATGFPTDYAKGNCAHCHEQHASIAGTEPAPKTGDAAGPDKFCLLANNFDTTVTAGPYVQDDNACFYCHTSIGSLQDGVIVNNNYSATFGGATATVTGIMQAFNSTSYHNLNDVLNFAKGASGWSSTFTADSNPCSACHNVHIAKRNKAYPGNPAYTAISKPSAHNELWGDDTPNERMTAAAYGTNYQPPYDADDINLEPDGAGTDRATQAGKTPDYNTFCLDCHKYEVPSSRTSLNPNTTSGYLTAIDWSTTGAGTKGEKHGARVADEYITVNAPYTAGSGSLGYILSCLDCHEPHGSPNVFLIRNSVNGGTLTSNITTRYTTNWSYLCERCHNNNERYIHHTNTTNDNCYTEQSCGGCHGGGDQPPINCTNCHFHGSWVNDPINTRDKTINDSPTTRVTF
ncbi:MAG: cytochrome c3 family protein [Actinobacteria bacterium]|nr:cytochrome c3 family protein [Actinomycetota bacterium]